MKKYVSLRVEFYIINKMKKEKTLPKNFDLLIFINSERYYRIQKIFASKVYLFNFRTDFI
jgi:hypothetical protein